MERSRRLPRGRGRRAADRARAAVARGRRGRRAAAPRSRGRERDEPGRPRPHLHVRARVGGRRRLDHPRGASGERPRGPRHDDVGAVHRPGRRRLPVARARVRLAAERAVVADLALRRPRRPAARASHRPAGRGRRRARAPRLERQPRARREGLPRLPFHHRGRAARLRRGRGRARLRRPRPHQRRDVPLRGDRHRRPCGERTLERGGGPPRGAASARGGGPVRSRRDPRGVPASRPTGTPWVRRSPAVGWRAVARRSRRRVLPARERLPRLAVRDDRAARRPRPGRDRGPVAPPLRIGGRGPRLPRHRGHRPRRPPRAPRPLRLRRGGAAPLRWRSGGDCRGAGRRIRSAGHRPARGPRARDQPARHAPHSPAALLRGGGAGADHLRRRRRRVSRSTSAPFGSTVSCRSSAWSTRAAGS